MDKELNIAAAYRATVRWYKPITTICALVLLASFILTHPKIGVIAPKYKAISMAYPVNPAFTDRPYLFESASAVDVDVSMFGDKHDVDRLVSIAKSSRVIAYIVSEFNLFDHYNIDTAREEHPWAKAMGRFKKRYKAFKNEYRALEVQVLDKHNVMAARMANAVMQKVDEIARDMMLTSRNKMLAVFEKKMKEKRSEIRACADSIRIADDPLDRQLWEDRMDNARTQLQNFSAIYDQYTVITAENINTLEVMEEAAPPEEDEGLRRYLMSGAFLLTLLVLVITATIVEHYRKHT